MMIGYHIFTMRQLFRVTFVNFQGNRKNTFLRNTENLGRARRDFVCARNCLTV